MTCDEINCDNCPFRIYDSPICHGSTINCPPAIFDQFVNLIVRTNIVLKKPSGIYNLIAIRWDLTYQRLRF